MTSRRRKKVGAIAVAVVITLVLGACAGDDGGASQGPTPAATGGAGTGPAETGPAETGQPSAPASAAPDLVSQEMCSDGAKWRLELTDIGDLVKVRFEVHRSPVGHEWLINFRNMRVPCCTPTGPGFFRGTRVASDSGVFVVQLRYADRVEVDGVAGKAVDTQTGQVCRPIATSLF